MAKGSGIGITCPHCGQRALQKKTNLISNLTREKMYCCSNMYCGHVFVSIEEIQRTVVPSHTPKAGVNLPMTAIAQRLYGKPSIA